MHISPIGLDYGNLRQNKIKKSNSKVISNPVKSSDNTVKLSLEQLQKMNNISFKGDKAANSPNETEAVLNSPLLKTDENGKTFFHKASVEDLKARKQKITPQLLKIALSMQDNRGNTCLHYIKDPESINIIVDILGDKASEVLSEMLPIQDDAKETFLNCYHYQQYPETLEIYAKALKDKAPETFAKACLVRDNEGETPILNLIYYSNRSQESLDASKVVFRALGDKTTEVIEDYIGRFRISIFRYRIEPELAQIIVDNMGDDEAQQVLSEILPLRDNSNRTFLHYSQYLETLKIYAKALKDKAPETFAKAYPAEIIDKISYGYNARKLIHAIIAGEKV